VVLRWSRQRAKQRILILHDDKIMSERLARVEVLEKVLETAYRLEAYSYYGGKKPNAVRALRRRCPGWESNELENWLTKGIAVQKSASVWLEENKEAVFEQHRKDDSLTAAYTSFHEAHSEWPQSALDSLLNINFLYFYLM
jgi:hypothetical protein